MTHMQETRHAGYLRQDDVVALFDKQADRGSILVGVARREALVGRVEEADVRLSLDGRRDLLPLLHGGVDAGGVVGAGVEHEDGAVGRRLDVLHHASEVKPDRLLVVVPATERERDRQTERERHSVTSGAYVADETRDFWYVV